MELTNKEKIFLINQYKILSKLDPDNLTEYENNIKILTNGFSVFYKKIEECIHDEIPESKGHFVMDVLKMYRALAKFSKIQLASDSYLLEFRGFDGNDECEYLKLTEFIVNDLNLFAEQREFNKSLNSHAPMVERYEQMLEVWNSLPNKLKLSKDNVINIMNACNK